MANHFEAEMSRPRELLAPSLLLLLAESPGHGYELMERLKPLGFDWAAPGRSTVSSARLRMPASSLRTGSWARAAPGVGCMKSPLRAGSPWTARSPASLASNVSSPSTRPGTER